MASFDAAIDVVLKNEGGYCFDSSDPGGETNFGICKRQYPQLDIAQLTREDACNIYRRDYWYFDLISDQGIATKLFDMSVNMGKGTAAKLIQRACCDLNRSVAIDGGLGPYTIEAINSLEPLALLSKLRELAAGHYYGLVSRNPKLAKFLNGWLKRAAQ